MKFPGDEKLYVNGPLVVVPKLNVDDVPLPLLVVVVVVVVIC